MLTLYDALDAFLQEYRRCGELDGGGEDGRVWMTCDCGATLARLLTVEDSPVSESADRASEGESGGSRAQGDAGRNPA